MGRRRQQRRQSHGSAWFWRQTGCWYYTRPGTKRRVPLFDDQGKRIRGQESRRAADKALALVKLAQAGEGSSPSDANWLVIRVCSEYIQYCERGLTTGSLSRSHYNGAVAFLNDFAGFCGSLPGRRAQKRARATVVGGTQRMALGGHSSVGLAIVMAAFNGVRRCSTSLIR